MKIRYLMTVGILTTLVVCLMSRRGAAEEVVRLTNGEWAPYFSEKLPHHGIGSRIVTEAFALEGITVKYHFLPWKRALISAQEGEYDGAVGWQINSDREPYFYTSETVWEAPWVFFHLTSLTFDWKTFDDLSPYKIGGTLEYMYTVEFLAAERTGKIKVDRVPRDEQNFRKLVAGRIELFPQLLDIGYYQVRVLFDSDTAKLITHHPKSFGTHAEQLLLSKKVDRSPRLVKIFNRGLKRLKESGTYNKFFEELR